jgi:hypothetical protein
MPNFNKKGMLLFIVVGIIITVAVLSTIILRIAANQASLTHHQTKRIQAIYAAKAGVIYALDKLRRNDSGCWPSSGSYTNYMKRSGSGCDVIEPDLPQSVSNVAIDVAAPGSGVSGTREVKATATFNFSP